MSDAAARRARPQAERATAAPDTAALDTAIRDGLGLDCLLAEVRRMLHADTAALLLVDRGRTMLETVATSGLPGRVRAAMRVRVGRGFAGQVALSRAPMVLLEVNDETVLDPAVRDSGVRRLLGVPLVSGSHRLMGVLHVGVRDEREFTDSDIAALQGAAEHLAEALQVRLAGDEHTAARVLQRSLLPTSPPLTPGLDLAGRYVPADGDLGGDWYDVFPLPGRRLGVVIGDVLGHGLVPAVIMGRLRSALRAYALEHDDPAEVLRLLDLKIGHFEQGALATVLYGVTAEPYDMIRLSCAGHPAPFLAAPRARTRQLTLPSDRMLGVEPGSVRHTTRVALPARSSLCLFTDGLVERRPGPGRRDQIQPGLDVLAATLRPGVDAELACTEIIATMLGDAVADDDIALLLLNRL